MAGFKIDSREIKELFKQLEDMPVDTIKAGYRVYKDTTPVKTGNAKSKTGVKTSSKPSARGNQIQAKYGYANKLDEGWSRQAPDGMSKGAIDEMDNFVDEYINRID